MNVNDVSYYKGLFSSASVACRC